MAQHVFKVEVGVKVGPTKKNLKKDIQNILDTLPKRKIALDVDPSKTKANIKKFITDSKSKYKLPIELTVQGATFNGTTGKNFRSAIRTITAEINKQQYAKIVMHLDTKATQRAMIAELKKLNLGVTITPNNGQNGGGSLTLNGALAEARAIQKEMYAIQKEQRAANPNTPYFTTLHRQYKTLKKDLNDVIQKYLQTKDAQVRGMTQKSQFEDEMKKDRQLLKSKRELERATAKVDTQQNNQPVKQITQYSDAMREATQHAVNWYHTIAKLKSTSTNDPNHQRLIKQAADEKRAFDDVVRSYIQTRDAQNRGRTEVSFKREVLGQQSVANAKQGVYTAQKTAATNAVKGYEDAVRRAVQWQIKMDQTAKQMTGLDKQTQQYAALEQKMRDLEALRNAERDSYVQSPAAQAANVTAQAFDKEVQAAARVKIAHDELNAARGRQYDVSLNRSALEYEKEIKMASRLSKQVDVLRASMNMATSAGQEWGAKLTILEDAYHSGAISIERYDKELAILIANARKAGALNSHTILGSMGDRIATMALSLAWMKVRQALRQVYDNVVALDKAMTELKKVTNETDKVYEDFFNNAGSRAAQLGATMEDMISATADFARLGYTVEDASALAETSLIYKNVGDGITDISEATDSLISTMKGFGLATSDAMSIVDKFNAVGNNFAISSGGIGDALQRSAAALSAANNNLDESIALVTAANTVLQDPEKVGTTLKTVSMFLRSAKTEAEDAGIATDEMVDSVSKLRLEIQKLTGSKVDIMTDASGNTFKSTYQILKEIAGVWDQLSDVSRANLLEKLAGKRNANALAAILQNFTIAEDALRTSQTSAGSALEENAKYMDSITGKLQALQASWEQFSANVLNSAFVKNIIDILKKVVDKLNELDTKTHGVSSSILLWVTTTTILTAVLAAVIPKIQKLKLEFVMLRKQSMGASTGLTVFGQTAGFAGLKVAALTILVSALAAAAVFMYKKWREANPTFEDLRSQLSQTKQDIEELQGEIDTLTQRIEELQELADNGTISVTEEDELKRLREQNSLLETQLKLKQTLEAEQANELRNKALIRAKSFLGSGTDMTDGVVGAPVGHQNSGSEDVEQYIKQYQDASAAIAAENERALAANEQANQSFINTQGRLKQSALQVLKERSDTLIEIIQALDPEKDKEEIKALYGYLDKITLATEGSTAAQQMLNSMQNRAIYSDAIEKIKKLGDEGKLTGEKLENLYKINSDVREFINDASEKGLVSTENFESMAQIFNELPELIDPATSSIGDLVDELDAVHEKAQALKDAKEAITSTGKITISTLKSIAKAYGSAGEEQVALYAAGIISASDMVDALEGLYQEDIDNINETNAQRLMNSETYYTNLLTKHDEFLIKMRGMYKIELEDCKTLEEAKSKIRSAALQQWMRDYGSAIGNIQLTESTLLTIAYEDNATTPAQKKRQSAAKRLLQQLKEQEDYFKSITFKPIDFSGLLADKDKDKDKGTDKYKEQAELEIKELQYQRDTDKISAQEYYDRLEEIEKRYYLDSATHQKIYADEILDINKELFNGRREIFDDWVEDELRAIEKMQSANIGIPFHIDDTTDAVKKLKKEIDDLAVAWNKANNGNIDYRKRPILTGADILKAGWNSAQDIENLKDASGVNTYTQGYYGRDLNHVNKNNLEKYIEITPILDNGEILSPESLNAYVDKIFSSTDVLSADKIKNGGKGLIVSIWDNPSDKELDDYFNKLQTIKDAHLDASLALQDLLNNGGITQAESAYYNVLKRIEAMIENAYKNGNDENSDYIQQLEDKYKEVSNTIVSMVQTSYDNFKSYADDFNLWGTLDFSKLDYLKKNLKEIERLYKNGIMAWKDYVDAYNKVAKEIYDQKKSSMDTILDLTMDMIKQETEDEIEALEKQSKDYKKIIDQKKELLEQSKNQTNHEKEVADAVKEIAKLQSKIAQLSLDNSRESVAKRIELEEQLAEKQASLNELQQNYAYQQTTDALDKDQEAFEDEQERKTEILKDSIDTWTKLYDKAIKKIDGNWEDLHTQLQAYVKKHKNAIDGEDSLESAWKDATDALSEYGKKFAEVYKMIPNVGIDPDAVNSQDAKDILSKMQANSAYALLHPGSGLSTTNQKLADDYYNLTGRKLAYNPSIGWVFDSKTSTNAAYEIMGESAKSNPYSAGTAKYGETRSNAVKWIQTQLRAAGYKSQPVDGNYWQTTAQNVADFANKHNISSDGKAVTSQILKYLKAYHTGGIVDGTGAINSREVLAILQKGEMVLTSSQQRNLASMLAGLRGMISSLASKNVGSGMRPLTTTSSSSLGNTFAPQISINISHNGNMTDHDAKRYGDIAADAALEKLRTAFNKRGIS